MDQLNTIKEILALFEEHQLTDLSIEDKDFKLSLKSTRHQAPLPSAKAASLAAFSPEAFSSANQPVSAPLTAAGQGAAELSTQAATPKMTEDPAAMAKALQLAFADGDLAAQKKWAEQAGWKAIKSPMLGTFYEAARPGAEALAKIGDKKKKGEALCIIEAMKMMNEFLAPQDLEIKQIAVHDGEIVEYGQVLFWIDDLK